jgi:hypothetical protein
MTEAYSFIRFEAVGAVGCLEFNRPPVNAFTRPTVDETHLEPRGAVEINGKDPMEIFLLLGRR